MCLLAEAKTVVHECVYENNTYKDGQRFYVDDYFQCVCSPDFNGNCFFIIITVF